MQVDAWTVRAPREPMIRSRRDESPGPDEVVVEVAGCGVCHTDLGFYYDGVPTRHPMPLTLGHEISGRVVEAGVGADEWLGCAVVVPAVIPCGRCRACAEGHASICGAQIFPGNDVHGGFATHVRVPARGLCPVPDLADVAHNPQRLALADLAVLADAVTTPYQAILRSGLREGDLAVFVGTGGVGGFGVQIAAALGAHVVAVDTDPARLDLMCEHGARLALQPDDFATLKKQVRTFASEYDVPSWRRRIFETSGTPAGQETAFGLLEHGGYLGVIGFTPHKVTVRLSNLMAFDATARGCWGCEPRHYPAALDLVLSGRIALPPFVEHRPLSSIQSTFEDLHDHRASKRIVLCPERES